MAGSITMFVVARAHTLELASEAFTQRNEIEMKKFTSGLY